MKYVFFGSPEFARAVLVKLCAHGHIPVLAVCSPDRPAGRKKQVISPPVKRMLSQEYPQVEVLQPDAPADIIPALTEAEADFFVVAAYAKILPADIVALPRLGTIGVHPSLLPRYRGASPIQEAILHGDKETGTTLYLLDEKMDHGPILAASAYAMRGSETYDVLESRLAEMGGELLIGLIPNLEGAELSARDQDHSAATATRKFTTQDGYVSEGSLALAMAGDAEEAVWVDRSIRAFSREPGAWTQITDMTIASAHIRGKRVKLLASRLEGGKLRITKIQVEGKNPVTL